MFNLIKRFFIKDNGLIGGATRSPEWRGVAERHLATHPNCAVCGWKPKIGNNPCHHKRPFHLHPELELDPNNLITLCEKTEHSCHWIFGHLYDYKAYNPNIEADSQIYKDKISNRLYE